MRTALIILIGALARPAAAAEPVPIDQAKLVPAPLKAWGQRHYEMLMRQPDGKRAHVGGLTMTSTQDEKSVGFEDRKFLTLGNKTTFLEWKIQATQQTPLVATRITISDGHEEHTHLAEGVVEGKTLRLKRTDHGQTFEADMDWPDWTLTEPSLYRLVVMLPRTAGTTYRFKSFVAGYEFQPIVGKHTITCKGPEPIERDGANIPCTRYDLAFEGYPSTRCWVDGKGVLQRVSIAEDAIRYERRDKPVKPPAGPGGTS